MVIIDQPLENLGQLRAQLLRKLPEAAEQLQDSSWNIAINGNMVLADENQTQVPNGSQVKLLPIMAGG